MKSRKFAFTLILAALFGSLAVAEEAPPAEKKENGPLISTQLRPKKKGKRREQKETDGSEAPGRFQADTILKSQYSRDGQPLEVDPD